MKRLLLVAVLVAVASFAADARKKGADLIEKYPALEPYFSVPAEESVKPDDLGFIRRCCAGF